MPQKYLMSDLMMSDFFYAAFIIFCNFLFHKFSHAPRLCSQLLNTVHYKNTSTG
jgi:hypothetical protein